MKLLNKILTTSLLASSSLLASDISIDSIGFNYGISSINYDQQDISGSITLGDQPDKSFDSYEISVTLDPILDICKNNNLKPYVSYTYSSNTDLKHQYILAGVNKYYTPSTSKAELYAGALLGYGELTWKYDPLNSSKQITHNSYSTIAGLQTGLILPVSKALSFNIDGKYLIHDYDTKLNPSDDVRGTLNHDSTSVVSLGIQYKF